MVGITAGRPFMPDYGILPASEGTGVLPWSWAQERLVRSRNYWIATVTPAGAPHLTAVWGVWLDDALWFSSGRRSRKAVNIAAAAACTVSTETAGEAVIVEGSATGIDAADAPPAIAAAYVEKYGEAYPEDTIVFDVRPRVAFGFIERADLFCGSATRWEFADATKGAT